MEKIKRSRLKFVRSLLREKKVRDASGVFVAEGNKIVLDILSGGYEVDSVFVSSKIIGAPFFSSIEESCSKMKAPLSRIPAAEFDKLSSLRNSQGVLAIVKKPDYPVFPEASAPTSLSVLCDGIQDPGNLGAIIRSSAAFGADSIILFGDTADQYNPKVVRASSGALLSLPLYKGTAEFVQSLKKEGYVVATADPDPGKNSKDLGDLTRIDRPLIVAFGSEGRGVSKDIKSVSDISFHIPVLEKVESLNVTAAASITLYVLGKKRFSGRGN